MKRVAIYCRYSTELQDETSIEDQTRLCRDFCVRQGWASVVTVYADAAKSGASRHNRPEYLRMMDDLRAKKFEALIVENISRLTRDVEDSAFTMKRAEFYAVAIYCANEGSAPISKTVATVHALSAELTREQGAQMIHRGMSGLILSGRSAGGKSYGYQSKARRSNERGGDLDIVEAEADIVREIFTRYVAGESPMTIAGDLNRRNIASPRAGIERTDGSTVTGLWSPSTINGNRNRETGILHNSLYAGVRKWNRTKHLKHPDTASRISRVNDRGMWLIEACPELAIIDANLWRAAQTRKAERGILQATHQTQRAKRLFSGLLRCGTCGHTVTSNGVDRRTGKTRLKCSGASARGICSAPVNCYVEDIERAILALLGRRLAEPEAMQAYIDEYVAERRRLTREAVDEYDSLAKRLAALNGRMDRMRKWALDETIGEAEFKRDYVPLRRERDELEAKLAAAAEPAPKVSLHPTAVASFKDALADLSSALCEDGERPSAKMIRSVIDQIIITPPDRPHRSAFDRNALKIEIIGGLDALLIGQFTPVTDAAPPVGGTNGSGGGT